MYTFVICSPFVEHPVVDVAQFDEDEYDIVVFEAGQPSNFLNGGKGKLTQTNIPMLTNFCLSDTCDYYVCPIPLTPRWLSRAER